MGAEWVEGLVDGLVRTLLEWVDKFGFDGFASHS